MIIKPTVSSDVDSSDSDSDSDSELWLWKDIKDIFTIIQSKCLDPMQIDKSKELTWVELFSSELCNINRNTIPIRVENQPAKVLHKV